MTMQHDEAARLRANRDEVEMMNPKAQIIAALEQMEAARSTPEKSSSRTSRRKRTGAVGSRRKHKGAVMPNAVHLAKPSSDRWRDGRRDRLHDLLGALGNSVITVDQFWRYMHDAQLDDIDIDAFCDEEARHIVGTEAADPMKMPTPRRFKCLSCGCEVHQFDHDPSDDDEICLNCK
jgi:hypothetical protein